MFVRKAATVVAGTLIALGLAVAPAAAAEPLAQPATVAAQAPTGLVSPAMWIRSGLYPNKQACNHGRFAATKQGWKTSDCHQQPGGGWAFGMGR